MTGCREVCRQTVTAQGSGHEALPDRCAASMTSVCVFTDSQNSLSVSSGRQPLGKQGLQLFFGPSKPGVALFYRNQGGFHHLSPRIHRNRVR
jgi:hypothetical protein